MRFKWAVLLAAFAAVPAFAASYEDVMRQLHASFDTNSIPQIRRETAVLAKMIDESQDLSYDEKGDLSKLLLNWATNATDKPHDLKLDFLHSGDDRLASLVIEDWSGGYAEPLDDDVPVLVAFAQDAHTSTALRIATLWIFERHKLDVLEPAALALAKNHDDRELAHGAAGVLVASWQDEHREKISAGLHSPLRAIREQCALLVAHDEKGFEEAPRILMEVALDASEPAQARLEAIQSLGSHDTDEVHAFLIRMLEPGAWFCGELHSVGYVVEALRWQPREGDQLVFEQLLPKLQQIPAAQREYPEWRTKVRLGLAE